MCDSDGGTLKQNEKGTREEAEAQRNWRFQNLHHHHSHPRTPLPKPSPFRAARIDLTPGIRRISGIVDRRRRDCIGMEGGGGGVPQEN